MKTVTESIFDNGHVIVAMADVQHIEYLKYPNIGDNGIHIITKPTTYNRDIDGWENAIYIPKRDQQVFLSAWCTYRNELEGNIITPVDKTEVQDELSSSK